MTKTNTVCIIGRPNVGKSSLFNRIIRRRHAIVHAESGTTRDWLSGTAEHNGAYFNIIDTGGFIPSPCDKISKLIKEQITSAINKYDVFIFVCDVTSGITSVDRELSVMMQRSKKEIFLAVNKADNKRLQEDAVEFYELGLGEPYPVSALHDIGVDRLLDAIAVSLGLVPSDARDERGLVKVAIVGRPNVGKSSYVNCLLDEERAIVDEKPGTTRDATDTHCSYNGAEFILIDTAGIRHKRKIKEAVDVYGMMRTKEAIERCDVAVVMLDGYDGLRLDDIKILNLVSESGKGCVLAVNKWDLVKGIEMQKYKEHIIERADFCRDMPIVFISSLAKRNISKPMDAVISIIEILDKKVPPKTLNDLLLRIKNKRVPAGKQGIRLTLSYIAQVGIRPPKFLVFVNKSDSVNVGFDNYLKRILRQQFDYLGVPIMIDYRSKKSVRG